MSNADQQAAEVAKQIADIKDACLHVEDGCQSWHTERLPEDEITAILAPVLAGKDKRIHDLEVEVLGLRGAHAGLVSTFETWQADGAELAKEFPGVDWNLCKDFVPHVRSLRAANAALAAEVEDAKSWCKIKNAHNDKLVADLAQLRAGYEMLKDDCVRYIKARDVLRADKEAADGLLRDTAERYAETTARFERVASVAFGDNGISERTMNDLHAAKNAILKARTYLRSLTPPTAQTPAQTEEGKQ